MSAIPRIAILTLVCVSAAHTQQPSSTPSRQLPDNPTPQPSSTYQPNPDENGIYHFSIADGVKAPTVIYTVEPEFSEAARKRKVAGDVTIKFIVDAEGHPRDLKVIKSTVIPNTSPKDRAAGESLEPRQLKPSANIDSNRPHSTANLFPAG